MKETLYRLLALIPVLLTAAPVTAKECAGVSFPEQVQVGGTRLELNGLGLREATLLKVDVYVAALYVDSKSSNPDPIINAVKPKRLVLHFLRDVGLDDITNAWNEGFEASAKGTLPVLKDRIATLNGWMEDMVTGKRLTFTYTPAAGVEVDIGGKVKGTIKGDDFAKALFAIWLGAKPPNPDLKTGLLGGACG